jgi:hypothetical protein
MIAEFNPADIGRVVAKVHSSKQATKMALLSGRRRQQHRVDDMNDTVRCFDVGPDHVGVVHPHAERAVDVHRQPGRGLDLQGLAGDIGGFHTARHHVVFKDRCKLGLVLEEPLDGARRQFGEGGIVGSKHGVGPLAFQRLDETRRLHGGDQRVERTRGDRGIDDIGGPREGRREQRGDQSGAGDE